ncbi:MAG: CvpA family protein [Patescibacteria group bacterium]
MSLQGNWIDLLILIVLLFFVLEGLEQGFWRLAAEFFSFLGSLLLAIRFYSLVAKFLVLNFSLSYGFANALGFLFTAIFAETALAALAFWFFGKIPQKWLSVWWNKILGVVPAILNGLVLIAFFLTLIIALPITPFLKKDITSSRIGGYLVGKTFGIEHKFNEIFGGAVEEALTFLTVKPESRERIDLRFTTKEFSVDQLSETKMFALVNEERERRGIKKLEWDPRLVVVAREHAKDMFLRGYFSHYSPEGENVSDRLKDNHIDFAVVGENLALAPTVFIAHQGLMASSGHRANILSPEFSKVGIGVIDGGIYGKMFTQVFTD